MSNGGDRASYFGIGFLVGAVAGLAIGILYAPKAGTETRALIREKTGEYIDEAKEKYEKAKEKVSSLTHRKESEA